jgi:membrane-associated phospholipid phosphatase
MEGQGKLGMSFGRLRGITHYHFSDYATQGYLALSGGMVLFLYDDAGLKRVLLVLAHALGLLSIHALIHCHARRPHQRMLDVLRHFYPVLLYTLFYRETGALNQMLVTGYLDAFFIRLEHRLFGGQPSLAFMEWLPYVPVSEMFYAAYFSYYVMIIGVGLALFVRHRDAFFHYVSVVSLVFYVCYLTYIVLPVMGPRVFYRDLTAYRLPADVLPTVVPAFPAAITAGSFYQIMAWIYRTFEAPGAAFPSSHVAVAIVTVYFSSRYLPGIWRAHLVMVILLCLSTIYCRYHYAVDVVAGAVVAWTLMPLGNALYGMCEKAPLVRGASALKARTDVPALSRLEPPLPHGDQ